MWAAILCADWSKKPRRREVYAARIAERRVGRLAPPQGGWNLSRVLAAAERLRQELGGALLVGFDAPIGVPRSYWSVFHTPRGAIEGLGSIEEPRFLDWLRARALEPPFFEPVLEHSEWSAGTPFFHVPRKGLNAFVNHLLARHGVEAFRGIDKLAKGKSPFVASGIAGAPGGAVIDLWRGLGSLPAGLGQRPGIWPFDGDLDLLATNGVVLAEVYPLLAYAIAATEDRPVELQPLDVKKGRPDARVSFVGTLLAAEWPKRLGVSFEHVEMALASEDAFDAMVTVSALLRCALEGVPFSSARYEHPVEGGILGSGAVRLDATRKRFRTSPVGWRSSSSASAKARAPQGGADDLDPIQRSPPITRNQAYRCPIPECSHLFKVARLGWDAHVGSLRLHPDWYPNVHDPEERKRLFRRDFAAFFE
jgi:hypothetical protein